MEEKKRRSYQTKRLKPVGDWKLRPCLGHECDKKIYTTPGFRFCDSCKKSNEKVEDFGLYETSPGRQKEWKAKNG